MMQYIYDHPEMVAIIWPIFTGLLSFAFRSLGKRWPFLVAILAASGLDLPALGAALRKRLEAPTKDEPEEKKEEKADDDAV